MKKFLLLFCIITSFSFTEECHPESGWCFNQAINFAFYIFEEANLNGIELALGELEANGSVSCPSGDCDVVGAFNGDVCVGWSTYYRNYGLDNKFTLAVNGYDGNNYSEGYLVTGQVPTFKFYDSSTGVIIDAESSIDIPYFQNFGGFIMGELSAESENISNLNFPTEIKINSIFPNPFNPTTQLDFTLNKSENITIKIFDIYGNLIDNYPLGLQNAGNHIWTWNATKQPSGLYFIQLNSSIVSKVILLK